MPMPRRSLANAVALALADTHGLDEDMEDVVWEERPFTLDGPPDEMLDDETCARVHEAVKSSVRRVREAAVGATG